MFFSCSFFNALGQDQTRQVRNIQALGKIAGYVQFFSASDAGQTVTGSWDCIYISGVLAVKNCKDDQTCRIKSIFHSACSPRLNEKPEGIYSKL